MKQETTCSAQPSCRHACCLHTVHVNIQRTVCTHGHPHCSNNQLAVATWDRCEAAAEPAISTDPDEGLFIHTTAHVQHLANAPMTCAIHEWLATNPSGYHYCSAARLRCAGCGAPPKCLLAYSSHCLQRSTMAATRSGVQHCLPRAAGGSAVCIIVTCPRNILRFRQEGSPRPNQGIPQMIVDMP